MNVTLTGGINPNFFIEMMSIFFNQHEFSSPSLTPIKDKKDEDKMIFARYRYEWNVSPVIDINQNMKNIAKMLEENNFKMLSVSERFAYFKQEEFTMIINVTNKMFSFPKVEVIFIKNQEKK